MFVDMVVNSYWVWIDFRSPHLFGPAWTPSPWGMLRMIDGTWCRLLNAGCHPQLQNLLLLLQILWKYRLPNTEKTTFPTKKRISKYSKTHNHLFRFPRFCFFHQKPPLGVPTSGHIKAWPVIASVARHLPRRDEVPRLLLDHACLHDGAHGCRSEGTPCILGCLLDFVICWVVLWLMANKTMWHLTSNGHVWPILAVREICQVGDVIVTLLKALYYMYIYIYIRTHI